MQLCLKEHFHIGNIFFLDIGKLASQLQIFSNSYSQIFTHHRVTCAAQDQAELVFIVILVSHLITYFANCIYSSPKFLNHKRNAEAYSEPSLNHLTWSTFHKKAPSSGLGKLRTRWRACTQRTRNYVHVNQSKHLKQHSDVIERIELLLKTNNIWDNNVMYHLRK